MFSDFFVKTGISSDKTSFVKGCTTLKLESLKHHETSNMHLFSALVALGSDGAAVMLGDSLLSCKLNSHQ